MTEHIDSNELTLFNSVLASLADPQRGIHGYKKGRYSEGNRRFLQRTLISAQRFVLDDKLVEHCSIASCDNPLNLVKMAKRAIPPFEVMWIEWNERHHVNTLLKENKRLFGERNYDTNVRPVQLMGYLIQRLNGHFLFTPITESITRNEKTPKTYVNGTSFYFSNDTVIDYEWTLSPELDAGITHPTADEHFQIQQRASQHLLNPDYWNDNRVKFAPYLDWFAKRLLISQSAELRVDDESWRRGWDRNEMSYKTAMELELMTGDLRFLVCALAFLNYDHIIIQNTKPNKNVKHMRYGHRVPENEYRTVYIDLPKRCKTLRRGILTGTGSPKKEHWRRGHWRVVEKDKFGNVTKRTWIAPMKVGNPELGVIEHDYILRGKRA